MIEFLHTAVAFIVAISLLITVHEFGHFSVARRLGVKVEKFSIGFGPALFSWRSHDQEVLYVIASIPLGGYVKMLGENPGEDKADLSEAEKARAFDTQPVWKRAAIAVAGPGSNFIFAVLAYMITGWIGLSVLPPVIGNLAATSVASQAGLVQGDTIVDVQGRHIHAWRQVEEALKDVTGKEANIRVQRQGAELSIPIHVPTSTRDPLLTNVAGDLLGMGPDIRVIAAGVVDHSPADQAGMQAGDVIIRAEGTVVNEIQAFIAVVQAHAGKEMTLDIQRNHQVIHLNITPQSTSETGHGRIGIRLTSEPSVEPVIYRMGVWEGIHYGFGRTMEITRLTLQVFGRMVTASISPENLGGPIAIAQIAGKSAELGAAAFISFLALISVNLGVLNLLPIPVLDGGHLLYLLIERLRGKAMSENMMERTQMVGIVLIGGLMLFAFYNDIMRLFR